jgi:hypothetical protein
LRLVFFLQEIELQDIMRASPILSRVLLLSHSFAANSSFVGPSRQLPLVYAQSMTLLRFSEKSTSSNQDDSDRNFPQDPVYPGTSVTRLNNVHKRVAQLTSQDLSLDWEEVRRKLLWAGGLRDLPNVAPGMVRHPITLSIGGRYSFQPF